MKIILVLLVTLNSWFLPNINPPENIKRILESGNGKTIETVYKVYSIDEEYNLLRHLKLTSIMQKLHVKDGDFYDAIKTADKTIYFKVVIKKLNKISPMVI